MLVIDSKHQSTFSFAACTHAVADIDTDAHKPNLTDFEHDATVLDVE